MISDHRLILQMKLLIHLPIQLLAMDPGYIMLPRTYPLVVQPLRTSLLVVQLYGTPRS